eukprot:4964913-Pyramimonas_sp.AAC.1
MSTATAATSHERLLGAHRGLDAGDASLAPVDWGNDLCDHEAILHGSLLCSRLGQQGLRHSLSHTHASLSPAWGTLPVQHILRTTYTRMRG